jgi:hypothetical protein
MIVIREVKIKYDHLDIILKEKLQDIRFSSNVNVVVDLKEVFRKIFRPSILEEEKVNQLMVQELSSDIINVVAHYRNYLYKSGKYSSFYFLYSTKECAIMKEKYDGYKKEYYEGHFYSKEREKRIALVSKVAEVLSKILNQIPNCNFIDTSRFDEYVVAKYLVNKVPGNELNLILSNDEIMAQLIGKNTFMIDLRSNESEFIDSKNAVKILLDVDTKISSNLISLIASISGTERYSLENINRIGSKKSVKMVDYLLLKQKIFDREYIDFPLKLEELDPTNKIEKTIIENFELLKKNYSIITSNDVLYKYSSDIMLLFNKAKQSYPLNHFTELNAKVFTTYPLMLDMILKGELN